MVVDLRVSTRWLEETLLLAQPSSKSILTNWASGSEGVSHYVEFQHHGRMTVHMSPAANSSSSNSRAGWADRDRQDWRRHKRGKHGCKKGARNEHAAEADEHVCARGTGYWLEPRALSAAGRRTKMKFDAAARAECRNKIQRSLQPSDWRASRRQSRRESCFEGRLFMLCHAGRPAGRGACASMGIVHATAHCQRPDQERRALGLVCGVFIASGTNPGAS